MKFDSFRDTWAEVSLNAVRGNLHQFRKFIGQRVKLMAVVKADGYGHGAVEVSKAAIASGADYLAVAILDEALELREAGISHPLLILGYTPERSVRTAIMNQITLSVASMDMLDSIITQAQLLKMTAGIHLKIDTGMSRFGVVSQTEAVEMALKAASSNYIRLEGIFTHFANADSPDASYTHLQFERFQRVLQGIKEAGVEIPLQHCCNSAAAMNYPSMHLDMVRIGIALYGLYPDSTLKKHPIQLKPAMALKTKISMVKEVPATQPVGYGCTWTTSRDSILAILPIGYADGFSRLLSNRINLLVHEQSAPLVGRVCMDQAILNVTKISSCQPGDTVTIFGRDGSAFQSVDEIAEKIGTINYEVVCMVGKRVPRLFIDSRGNEIELDQRNTHPLVIGAS
ncbi:alanine racemase [Neobacillus notoginsengisoli]|uniref:Alanine racemase n=1 Tax=Neobacillus notoginsengisoli TaxID=1578198 RepID=A0A417YL41_9BACI|nr:alanine racemase [Neobacillus notoginsengisoli]RHW34170.1 alanine racemase [Neobacillus notoginsengisoli]